MQFRKMLQRPSVAMSIALVHAKNSFDLRSYAIPAHPVRAGAAYWRYASRAAIFQFRNIAGGD